jgi:hypothetical protein
MSLRGKGDRVSFPGEGGDSSLPGATWESTARRMGAGRHPGRSEVVA